MDLITVVQKTNQQTFIENLCRLNATHANLSKMFPALRTSQFHVGDRQVDGQLKYNNRSLIETETEILI